MLDALCLVIVEALLSQMASQSLERYPVDTNLACVINCGPVEAHCGVYKAELRCDATAQTGIQLQE